MVMVMVKARDGLEVEVRPFVADVANTILAHAADNAVDFMVNIAIPARANSWSGAPSAAFSGR
jgi:hypothetical protein